MKSVDGKGKIILGKEVVDKVPESWNDDDLEFENNNSRRKMSFVTKFFIISVILFTLVASIVTYLFLNQGSNFSEKRILIEATGPGSTTSGSKGEINIQITNNNNVPITDAYLTISYDSGENISGDKNITNQSVEVGQILANSVNSSSLDFTIYGSEGTVKDIQPVFHYKLADSKAEFTKNSNLVSVTLKSSPVTLNVSSLKEIHQNYDLTFNLNIKNNTEQDIKDLIVTARNPNNFIYSSSSLTLLNSTPSWKIDLAPNENTNITMSGKATGNIGDKLNFTFYTGIANSKNENSTTSSSSLALSNFDNYYLNIDNVYSKVERSIDISGQYLDFNIANNSNDLNQGSNTTLNQGEAVILDFNYNNNTNFPLTDLSLYLNILGDYIDKNSMQVNGGYYDTNQNVIIWNKNSNPDLAKLGANQSGSLEIRFRIKNNIPSNSQLEMIGGASANRNSEDNVSNTQDISFDKVWTISDRQY